DPFCLILPPQVLGEEMEKAKTIADGSVAQFEFSPPTRLQLNPNIVRKRFAEPPWNLRRLLGTSGEPAAGPVLTQIQYELLYGLFCDVRPQALRLADIFSRV